MSEQVKVTKIEKNPGSTTLIVRFSNGKARQIDFSRYAGEGPVFKHLVEPDYVNSIRKTDYGFGVAWPDGMDMAAGAVLKMGRALPAAGRTAASSGAKPKRPTAADKRK